MFVAYLNGGKLHSKASQTLNSNCSLKEQNYEILKSDKITFQRWQILAAGRQIQEDMLHSKRATLIPGINNSKAYFPWREKNMTVTTNGSGTKSVINTKHVVESNSLLTNTISKHWKLWFLPVCSLCGFYIHLINCSQIQFVCKSSLVWPHPPPRGKELKKKSSQVQCISFKNRCTLYKDLNNRCFKTCFPIIYN